MNAPAERRAWFAAHPESDLAPFLEQNRNESGVHLYPARSDPDRHQAPAIESFWRVSQLRESAHSASASHNRTRGLRASWSAR